MAARTPQALASSGQALLWPASTACSRPGITAPNLLNVLPAFTRAGQRIPLRGERQPGGASSIDYALPPLAHTCNATLACSSEPPLPLPAVPSQSPLTACPQSRCETASSPPHAPAASRGAAPSCWRLQTRPATPRGQAPVCVSVVCGCAECCGVRGTGCGVTRNWAQHSSSDTHL